MTKYLPIYEIDAEAQILIYTHPAPTEKEWEVIRGIITHFSEYICTERAQDAPINVFQRPQTNTRAISYLCWNICLKFADTPADEIPSPFAEWLKDETLWSDSGRFIGDTDNLREVFRNALRAEITAVSGGDIEGLEIDIEIHGGWPAMRLNRVQE